MIKYRFLIATFVGTIVYVAISMFGGRDGKWAMEQMQEQRRILTANMTSIEKMNEELNLEKVSLESDSDVIAAYARKLGYIKEGERLIKITGLSSDDSKIFDAGIVVKHIAPDYMPEWFCKGISLLIFFMTYGVLFLASYGKILYSPSKNKAASYRTYGNF